MNLKPRANRAKKASGSQMGVATVCLSSALSPSPAGPGPVSPLQPIRSTNHPRKRKTATTAHRVQTFCGPNLVLYHPMDAVFAEAAMMVGAARSLVYREALISARIGGWMATTSGSCGEAGDGRNLYVQIGPKVLKKGFGHHHHHLHVFDVVVVVTAFAPHHLNCLKAYRNFNNSQASASLAQVETNV